MTKSLIFLFLAFAVVDLAYCNRSPESSEYLLLRLSIGRGEYDEALDRCERLLEQFPAAIGLYETVAEVGQYCSRLPEVNMMLANRVHAGKAVALALFGRGHVFLRDGKWANALEMFDRAIYFGLRSPLVYAGREFAYEKLFGIEGAIEFYLASSHREPGNAGVWYSLALAYWSRCDQANSLLAIDEALRIVPNEARFTQLKAGMMCTWLLDESTISDAVVEVENAIENCDFDGAEFVRWCLIDGLYSRGRQEMAASIVSESYESVCRFGQVKWLAHIHLTTAVNQLSLGETREALNHANAAAKWFCLVNDVDGILSSKAIEIGILRESNAVGDALKVCLDFYSRLVAGGDSRLRGGAFIEIAWTLSEIGAFRPALGIVIEAQRILQRCTYAEYDHIRLNTALGLIHQKIGNCDLALRYHLRALELAKASGRSRGSIATCEGNLATALLSLGDTLRARNHFQRELTLARNLKEIGQEKEALLQLAELDVAQNQRGSAKERTRLALALAERQGDDRATSRCHYLLGWMSEIEGRKEAAKVHYSRVLHFFMGQGMHKYLYMLSGETREWFLRQRDELIVAFCRIGQPQKAWVLTECTRRGVNLVYHMRLANASDSVRAPQDCQDFRRCVHSFATMRWKAIQVLEAEHPDWDQFFSLLSGCIANVETIQRLSRESSYVRKAVDDQLNFEDIASSLRERTLGTQTAMLDFRVCESSVIRFVVTRDTLISRAFVIDRETLRQRVTSFIEFLSGKGEANRESPGIEGSSCSPSGSVFDSLLGDASESLASKKDLIIVADSPLDALPFECLRTRDSSGVRFLLEIVAVSYASCLSFLDPTIHSSPFQPARILVLADPRLSEHALSDLMSKAESIQFGLEFEGHKLGLPVARKEAAKIQQVFRSDCTVRMGTDATETLLKQEASQYSVIHLAAHASPPRTSGDSQAVFLSESDSDDGVLSYIEIAGLDVQDHLIVVCGCNTAVPGDVQGSLADAFMEAGAASVVATRFELEDAISDELMASFYRYLREGQTNARSLQLAKIQIMKEGHTDVRLWSAYQLFGCIHRIVLVDRHAVEPFASARALVAASLLLLVVLGLAVVGIGRIVMNDFGRRGW
ncbi:MAG: CHAT domain-containing protein [Bacteroidetes bacterium]|nr:CHAT domain-containing protein [Bacteroidota bacterium]